METVYITGHRNPDIDSVCSAYCYAELKRQCEPGTQYIPVRCGALNRSAKELFKREGIDPPAFLKDLRPRIRDIVKTDWQQCRVHDPLYDVMDMLNKRSVSVAPVFDNNSYAGLISVDEVSAFFLREHAQQRPRYEFRTDNFARVLPGTWLKQSSCKEFQAPLMTGAMPLDDCKKRIEQLLPDVPLLVVGMRREIVDLAVQRQFPAIILTGYDTGDMPEYDFSSFQGSVFLSRLDTAETLRRLRLSLPIKNLLKDTVPSVQCDDLFDEVKTMLVSSEYRGLPVFEGESFVGFVTRRCFIDRPRKQIILMDHNESRQSIRGIEDAHVTEIIDHHRFAAERTREPIYISTAPVGSTCTIVLDHYRRNGIIPDPAAARLLMAGILSDTVLLKSPTATESDRQAVTYLASCAQVEDVSGFGEKIFSSGTVIADEAPETLILSDFKEYREFGCKFGIGQVEVVTTEDVSEVREAILDALEYIRDRKGLSWCMLLITDVIHEHSVLLSTPYQELEDKLAYRRISRGTYDLPGILSRKKQLLPEILRVLEDHSAVSAGN